MRGGGGGRHLVDRNYDSLVLIAQEAHTLTVSDVRPRPHPRLKVDARKLTPES